MKKVIAYLHTHWDREWYQSSSIFKFRLCEVLNNILDQIEKQNYPFFLDGQTCALEDYLEIKNDAKTKIIKLIKEKKLFIGPFYCCSDSLLIDAFSLISNLKYGIQYAKKMGNEDFLGYIADSFGHSNDLPIILNAFSIKYCILWRGLSKKLHSNFIWNNKIIAINLKRGYFHPYLSYDNSILSIEKKAQIINAELDKLNNPFDKTSQSLILPLGGDHFNIGKNLKMQVCQINNLLKKYKIKISDPFDYLKTINKKYLKSFNGELLDNSNSFILNGVYSTLIEVKQKNAQLQWKLHKVTKPFCSILSFFVSAIPSYKIFFEKVEKSLLKNQAHDSIYGCNVDSVYLDILNRYKRIDDMILWIINRVKFLLPKTIENKFCIVNLSNYKFCGTVEIVSCKKIPNLPLIKTFKTFPNEKLYNLNDVGVTEDYTTFYKQLYFIENLDPFEVKNINLKKIESDCNLRVDEKTIENENIKFCINKKNQICLEDKTRNKKFIDFLKITDISDISDSYNFCPIKNDISIEAKIVGSKIVQNHQFIKTLRIKFEIHIPKKSFLNKRSKKKVKTILYLDVSLEKNGSRIDFDINWINKSQNHRLDIQFKFKAPIYETHTDDLLNILTRSINPQIDMMTNLPSERGIELQNNIFPMQKFINVEGISIITKGLQSYEVFRNRLKLTILRSVELISNPTNGARGTAAGPPFEVSALKSLNKKCNGRFAICFDAFSEDKKLTLTRQQCVCFYNPVVVVDNFEVDKKFQFLKISNKNVKVVSMEEGKNGCLDLFLYNESVKREKTRITVLNGFSVDEDQKYILKKYNNLASDSVVKKLENGELLTLQAQELSILKIEKYKEKG